MAVMPRQSGKGLCAGAGCRAGGAGCRWPRRGKRAVPVPTAQAATAAIDSAALLRHSFGCIPRCALTVPAAAWRQTNGQETFQPGARSPSGGTARYQPGSTEAATWRQHTVSTQYDRRTSPECPAVCRSAAGGGQSGPVLRSGSRNTSEIATRPAAAAATLGCISTPGRGRVINNLGTSTATHTGAALISTSTSACPRPSSDARAAWHAGPTQCVPSTSSVAHKGGRVQDCTTAQPQQQGALQDGVLSTGNPKVGGGHQAGHLRPGNRHQQHVGREPQRIPVEGDGAGAARPATHGSEYHGQQDLEQQQQHGVRQYDDDDSIGRALKEAAARRERLAEALHGGQAVRVVVDCSFVHTLTSHKEMRSLVKQISSAMVHNRQAAAPVSLQVTSWRGELAAYAEGTMGAAAWPLVKHTQSTLEVYDPSQYDIVVLSPDAEEPLLALDERCVYVVGGIVDRTIRKGVTSSYASGHGLRARRLPTVEFAEQLGLGYGVSTRPVLNICDVVLALLRLRANGGDWADALDAAIPRRKRAAGSAGAGSAGAGAAVAAEGRGPRSAPPPASAAALAAVTPDQ